MPPILPVVFHPDYVTPLPKGHRFPMQKFGKIKDELLLKKIIGNDSFYKPIPATNSELRLAHDKDFVNRVSEGKLDRKAERILGFQCTPGIVRRAKAAVGGTILAGRLALKYKIACNTAGGSHHGHPGHAAGFCVFNDVAVAIKVLQSEGLIKKALIVDLDVHQGDGTASFFSHDHSVFTFSMHCKDNYPPQKKVSDIDIGLSTGTKDNEYIDNLLIQLPIALKKSEADIVFYNAGVDPHIDDKLGNLMLSDAGLLQRDLITINSCHRIEIPIACVVGGGYSNNIDELVTKHTFLYRASKFILSGHLKNKFDDNLLRKITMSENMEVLI